MIMRLCNLVAWVLSMRASLRPIVCVVMPFTLVTRRDVKVSIGCVSVSDMAGADMAGVNMAGADMAGAASARVCIIGRGTILWYLSPSISAHPRRVLGATALGRYIGES